MVNKLVVENLKHRPIRTFLTVAAIGLQVTMILTLVGLSDGTIEDSARRTRGVGADILIRPPASSAIGLSTAPIPEKLLPVLQKQPHVALVTGTVEQQTGALFERATGIDFDAFNHMSGGLKFFEGGLPKADDEIVVDDYYARQHKLHAGSSYQLLGGTWKISGVFEAGKGSRLFMRLKVLQDKIANPGRLSVVYVKADDPKNIPIVLEELKQLLPDNPIYTLDEFLSLISVNSIGLLKSFTNVVIGLSIVFGFLVVFLSMYTAVLERTREIGILKALGASPMYIVGILMRETIVLGLIGSVFGILLTYGTRFAIMSFPASLTQKIVPDWWPISTAIALVGAMLGALYPGLKAARQDAIEALTYE
ncbi:MAG: FtsX-like permease family protein [Bryobacteraceae bacterium]